MARHKEQPILAGILASFFFLAKRCDLQKELPSKLKRCTPSARLDFDRS
jgi:hypothetical protein